MKGVIDSSTRWYIDFLNSLPIAVYRTTIEGKIVFCNRAYARIFGFDNIGELIGYPVINLYRNKKDRGILVNTIMQRGRVTDLPVAFVKRDRIPIWCAVTARAVLDDDGIVVHLDGMMRDITGEIEEKGETPSLDGVFRAGNDIIFIFDLHGNILDVNAAGTELLGYAADDLRNRSMTDLLIPRHRELFLLFFSDILKFGSEQVVLSLVDKDGKMHHLDCHALLVKKENRAQHIKGIAQDITDRMKQQKARANNEKLQGVLEMAGGVAHRLNQPLTIVNNLLDEVISDIRPDDVNYEKIMTVQNQIIKMNEITQKIGNVRKYAAMDYVAGVKIVDIDKTS